MKQFIIFLSIALTISNCDRVKKLAGIKDTDSNEKNSKQSVQYKSEKLNNINLRVQNLEEAIGTINQKIENTELALESMENRVQQVQKQANARRYTNPRRSSTTRTTKRRMTRSAPRVSHKRSTRYHRGKRRYHIQVGAYKKKANAAALLQHMKKMIKIKFIIHDVPNQVQTVELAKYYDGDIAAHLGGAPQGKPVKMRASGHLHKVISARTYSFAQARRLLALVKRRGHDACLVQVRN